MVDLKGAYDGVQHHLLWERLQQLRVPPRLLQAIQSMYQNLTYELRVDGVRTDPFPVEQGVKQGCPLSPKLFNAFIDGLHTHLRTQCPWEGAPIDGVADPGFLYADDVVLVATSPAGLQKLIDSMQEFCTTLQLTISKEKTKVLAFNQPDRTHVWTLDGHSLARDKQFKYLGIVFDDDCSKATTYMAQTMAAARARALKAVYAAARGSCLITTAPKCATTYLQLMKHAATPTGTYGNEIWGLTQYFKRRMPEDRVDRIQRYYELTEPVEDARISALRGVFHLRPSTPKECILHELGMVPLVHAHVMSAVKYYNRVVTTTSDTEPESWDVYTQCMKEAVQAADAQHTWAHALSHALDTFVPDDTSSWKAKLQRMQPIDENLVSGALANEWLEYRTLLAGTKKSTYFHHIATHKAGDTPAYLHAFRPHTKICSMARFRLGSHHLHIETGRWERLPQEQRMCQRCGHNHVDDEFHLLFACEATRQDRERMGLTLGDDGRAMAGVPALFARHGNNPTLVDYVHTCMLTADTAYDEHMAKARTQAARDQRRWVPCNEPAAPLQLPEPQELPGGVAAEAMTATTRASRRHPRPERGASAAGESFSAE
jgi:hypothetical protein